MCYLLSLNLLQRSMNILIKFVVAHLLLCLKKCCCVHSDDFIVGEERCPRTSKG